MQRKGQLNATQWRSARDEATDLLQRLIRVDTTNPPGNELQAARLLRDALRQDGLHSEILQAAPGRANLVCRLAAGSEEPPLLLAGHLDVVPAGDPAAWTHPPFSGALRNGYVWGRGAVDMKNMVAMSAMVIKLLARSGLPLRRDLIFAAVADEEAGCEHGSRFLVEQHPEKVRAGYALGEVGGFPITVAGARLCLVQTAEKGFCWMRLTARGPGGHGSMPRRRSAVVSLGQALARLGQASMPQHNTPVVEAFIRRLARMQPPPKRWVLPRLLNPRFSPLILERLIPDARQADNFRAMLHNTVAPTQLQAGEAINVIPDAATALLDGRTLPGQSGDDLVRELRQLLGDDALEIEILRQAPGSLNHPPDSPLWDTIRAVIAEHDPSLTVVPYMIPGFTDGKYFSRLGARWYGFSPLRLDPEAGPAFNDLFHGVDERIPVDGFHWGLKVLYQVVSDFCLAR